MPPNEHRPLKRTILPYYAAAAVSFVIVALLCLVAHAEFTGHYFNPRLLAITHLFILGWGTMMIFGASNQLMPVLTERKLHSEQIPVYVLGLMLTGIPLLVYSFWHFSLTWAIYLGGILIIIGMGLHAFNIFKTAKTTKDNIAAEFMLSAHLWLLLTATIGFILLVNFRTPFLSRDHLEYLRLHASIGMAGWFLQLIIGVSSKLIPMFLISGYENKKCLNITYYCLNLGLIIFLLEGFMNNTYTGKLIPVAIIVAGVLSYGIYVRQCYKHAIKKHLDAGMKQTFIALGLLSVPFVLLLINLVVEDEVAPKLIVAYGFAFFAGFISVIIMGQTFKTLPFIVWMHLVKRNELPEMLPKDLYHEHWVKWQMYIYLSGYTSFLSGIVLVETNAIYAGASCMVIAASWYCFHVLLIMNKLRRK
jgi:hypothetical protein